MTANERDFLRSEVATLAGLLRDLSEERVIERMGLEGRLAEVRERLQALEDQPRAKRLPITFRGRPVEAMESIDAAFASSALKAFVEATDTVAASLTDDLKARGRLPSTHQRSLRIVDTACGSFGFELELPPLEREQQSLFGLGGPDDPYERAIETTFALIEDAATSDEEGMSDLIAEIHPRAAAKVRAFAEVLWANEAQFAAEWEHRRVTLPEAADVHRVLEALRAEDLNEREQTLKGALLGILPETRRFECRLEDGRLLTGRVDRTIADVIAFKQALENRSASLQFRIVTVRSNERYILTGGSVCERDDSS